MVSQGTSKKAIELANWLTANLYTAKFHFNSIQSRTSVNLGCAGSSSKSSFLYCNTSGWSSPPQSFSTHHGPRTRTKLHTSAQDPISISKHMAIYVQTQNKILTLKWLGSAPTSILDCWKLGGCRFPRLGKDLLAIHTSSVSSKTVPPKEIWRWPIKPILNSPLKMKPGDSVG